METPSGRRVIEVQGRVVGPTEPRLKVLRPRKLSDYPHVPGVYHDVARQLSSPARMGPPVCDELMALVQHVFSEEEAGVVRHLGLLSGRSAAELARAEHRPIDQVQPILDRLSNEKRVVVRSGGRKEGTAPVYRLLPIVPGIFEMMLISHTPESLTEWHRRFIELFESLYETGYSLDYQQKHPAPSVRYLPVGKAIDAHPMALPTDKLEMVLDQFKVFAVGQCQCRMAMQALGRGCGKPLGNCMVMGTWAERGVADGWLKLVSRNEALRNQARGRIARHGQLADERAIDEGAMLVLVLRLLLPCPADGQRVQRAGVRSRRPIFCLGSTVHYVSIAANARTIVRWGRSSSIRSRRSTRICGSAASAADCARWRATGSGRWRWSRWPTIGCRTAVGFR